MLKNIPDSGCGCLVAGSIVPYRNNILLKADRDQTAKEGILTAAYSQRDAEVRGLQTK